ncbi:MAG: starch-binding protein [Lachnospiraceae bacterium]|nr:starch-binding protein [Lachnospiraceae bacterium]
MNKPQISASTGNKTITGPTQVTFTAKNATSATYRVDNGTETAFTDSVSLTLGENLAVGAKTTVTITAKNADGTTSQTFTIGDSMEEGESITITVTGTGNKGNQETITATFTKEEQNTGSCVYFKNTDNWQQIFCYAWNSEPDKMTAWPGTAMKVYDETNQIYPELFIAVR